MIFVHPHRGAPAPRRARRTRRDRERGAVTILVAISMTALLILTSIVVDLGEARASKRALQTVADVAALAAGYHLSGHGNATVTADPRGGCTAAWKSIQRNIPSISATATIACTNLALTAEPPDCDTNTAMNTVTATGTGSYTVKISYPVPDSAIRIPQMLDGVGWNDGQPCTRMKVEISRTRVGAFSGMVGKQAITTTASSVVRGGINTQNGAVPALLMLHRTRCQAITNSSSGSGNVGIIVRRVSDAQGGHAHSDSDGSACGSNNTDYVVYGSPLNGGGTSITVENGANGILGSISTYATANGSLRGASTYPTGISHPGTAGPVVGRLPFDRNFNPTNRPSITNLHAAAYAAVNWTVSQAITNGYTALGCSADGTINGVKVFINCPSPSVWSPSNAFFNQATDVVVNGQVNIGAGKTVNMPNIKRFYVKGCPTAEGAALTCSGNNNYGVMVTGNTTTPGQGLFLNIGNNATATAVCSDRLGPGAGGTTTNTAVMVIFGSPMIINGNARLCQTTVYMAQWASTYSRRTATTGPPNCNTAIPCPYYAPTSTGTSPGGYYEVSGSTSNFYLDWTAPNQQSTVADANQPFEDLALWSESGGSSSTETTNLNQVKSGGYMTTSGIFFTPNGRVEFRSPAVGAPRNAQFVASSLQLMQGTLDLKPVSSDALRVPLPGGYGLIR